MPACVRVSLATDSVEEEPFGEGPLQGRDVMPWLPKAAQRRRAEAMLWLKLMGSACQIMGSLLIYGCLSLHGRPRLESMVRAVLQSAEEPSLLKLLRSLLTKPF